MLYSQARNGLGTPVPKVLAWSSKAKENPVGAEYIIMEKVSGVQLDKVWQKMSIKDRFEIVKTISRYQKAWTSTAFAQYGSLYYSSDLDISNGCVLVNEDGSEVNDCRFAVGPSTGREFLDDGRIALDFDRGPCKTLQSPTSKFSAHVPILGNSAEQYKLAIGLREIACVRDMAQLPRS